MAVGAHTQIRLHSALPQDGCPFRGHWLCVRPWFLVRYNIVGFPIELVFPLIVLGV
jgi:hypothetical protein